MRYGHQPLSEVMTWPMGYLHRVSRCISDSFEKTPQDPLVEDE